MIQCKLLKRKKWVSASSWSKISHLFSVFHYQFGVKNNASHKWPSEFPQLPDKWGNIINSGFCSSTQDQALQRVYLFDIDNFAGVVREMCMWYINAQGSRNQLANANQLDFHENISFISFCGDTKHRRELTKRIALTIKRWKLSR